MIFFEIPPRYKTKKPADAIKIDVPKSGCLTIKNKGTAIITVPILNLKLKTLGPQISHITKQAIKELQFSLIQMVAT